MIWTGAVVPRRVREAVSRAMNSNHVKDTDPNARAAYEANGYDMKIIPMRGGTDGAQLSYRGMPCPNMSAGYYNAHGVKEFCPVPELETMVDVLQTLVGLYAKPQDQQ